MADLVIFGTGDVAELAHHYFTTDSPHHIVGFTVDRAFRKSDSFLGLPLVDFEEVAERYPPASHEMFVAIGYTGMNAVRAARYETTRSLGYRLASYVSSRCTVLAQAPVGDNCLILEDNTIQPFAHIGNDVTLWSGNHIGHHSVIGDHCFVTSHVVVSGHAEVGPFCFLGVNATLRDGVRLAPGTLVGAGATILEDTEPNGVYPGTRARKSPQSSADVKP